MEENLDLEKEVKLEETSRNGYNDKPLPDNIFVSDKSSNNDRLDNLKKIVEKDKNISNTIEDDITIDFEKQDVKEDKNSNEWYFLIKPGYTYGDMYEVDPSGNLISKHNLLELNRILENNDSEDKLNLKEAIENTRQQIDFLQQQELLKEEIKGYPELSEKTFQLYNHDDTLKRFKNEKSILRALIDTKKSNWSRLLLTLCSKQRTDCFKDLKQDGIIVDKYVIAESNLAKRIFEYIINYLKIHDNLPPIQIISNLIGIPYSKEFFDEYLYDDITLDLVIEQYYKSLKQSMGKQLSNMLANNTITMEKAIDELLKIETLCTPINYDDAYNKLQLTLEERKNEVTISTGIKKLDENKAFLQKGKIATVFAYTGSFKTMFCSNVAYNVIDKGYNVLYLSLEVVKEDMYINFLSKYSYDNTDVPISHSDIKGNRLTKEEDNNLFTIVYPEFQKQFKPSLIVYDENDVKSNTYDGIDKLFVQADKEFIKRTGKGIDVIIIDHLNLFKFESQERTMNDYSAVNHWMRYFRKQCSNFLGQKRQVAILCACQSSREGYKQASSNGMYQLTGIAEGNEIERSSQLVLSILKKDIDKVDMQVLKLRDDAHKDDELIPIEIEPKYYSFNKNKTINNYDSLSEDYDDSQYEQDLDAFND